jgi:hypothetical protein
MRVAPFSLAGFLVNNTRTGGIAWKEEVTLVVCPFSRAESTMILPIADPMDPTCVCTMFVRTKGSNSHAWSWSGSGFDLTHSALAPWLHRRISPHSPTTSSSESSLLEEPTRGRHLFSNASVTPQRVRRPTVLIDQGFAKECVLVPDGTLDLNV